MLITIDGIRIKLNDALSPSYLEVINDSMLHSEHLPDVEENSVTHVTIKISSPELLLASRVKSHQMIYSALKEELDAGLHAISIKIVSGVVG